MSAKAFLDTNIIIYGYSQDEPDKQQRVRECAQCYQYSYFDSLIIASALEVGCSPRGQMSGAEFVNSL